MAEMTEHESQTRIFRTHVKSTFGLRAASWITTATLVLSTGCGGFFVYPGSTGNNGGGGSSATGDYIYVANATTANLAGFAVGTGTLTAVAGSPYSLTIQPTALAINPANTILYVAGNGINGGSPGIYAYSIQSTGVLTPLNGGSSVATVTVAAMDISPDGQWLIALDEIAGVVDEFLINPSSGTLTAQTGITYPASGAVPSAIKVSPDAQHIFAALGPAGVLVFPFSSGALFAPTQVLAPGTSDNALAIDPSSTHLFIARSGTNGGLAVDSINGVILTAVAGSPFGSTATATGRSVVLNKGGTAVYMSNPNAGTISGFSIGTGGVLTAFSGSPYSTVSQVTALALDNSGNYLSAAAQGGSPDLTLYSFDATTAGKLDLAASTATGVDPAQAIAIAATH